MFKKSITNCLFSFLLYLLLPLSANARVDFFCTGAEMGMGALADSLYLGASFFYLGSEPGATVAICTSDADWEGALYFMVPGIHDSAYYLFSNKPENHPNEPRRINLSNLFNIPVGATITFMYRVKDPPGNPLYTGENRPGIDEYVSTDTHVWQGMPGDRRWCTAGRIKGANGEITDSAEFTFEDAPNGDFDCNDIIFRVTGLGLNISVNIPRLDSSIVYDAVGNGIGDSLVIFFDHTDTTNLISVDLIWPQAAPVQRLDHSLLHVESFQIISIPYTPASQVVVTQGTGEVTMAFDSVSVQVLRNCVASDGIGPLLKDEALLFRRFIPDNDTFFVSFTEKVDVSQIMGTSFTLIKKNSNIEIDLTLLDAAVDLGGEDTIMFSIADLGTNAPEGGDSLKILSTGPVVDKPRVNHAHKDNTPVPIVLIERPTSVDVIKCYYFDNNAEGYIDSIYVELTTTLPGGLTDPLVQEIVDNAITLPAFRNFTVNSSGLTTGGFFLNVTEDNAHNPVTYTTLNDKLVVSEYTLSTGTIVKATITDIIDRVAPIIHWEPKSALLVDYQVTSKSDTLGVKFSEPVVNVIADEPFYFLDRDNNSNYTVTLNAVNHPKTDSMVFEVVSVSGVDAMEDGDSLWIHETDLVSDVEGNFQNNTANIKRRLYVEKIYGSVDIAKAYYFDRTADGYVDSIYAEATTDIDGGITATHVSELVNNAINFPGFRDFTTTGSGLTSGGFYIAVTEDKGHNPFTYVTDEDKLQIANYTFTTGGTIKAKTVTIYDRIAPIIHWEKKAAFLIDYMIDTVSDTLTVKFSEPIERVTSDEPFYFLDMDNNTTYEVRLSDVSQPEPDKMVFYVTSLSGVDYMEEGDSLWIHETDRVSDVEGNFQNNIKNTRRKLYVKKVVMPYTFIPKAVSPIDLTNMHTHIIPGEIISVLQSQGILGDLNLQQSNTGSYNGMLIMVIPDPENIGEFLPDLELEGRISVYDAVGNQIVTRSGMAWWDEKKSLVFVWNIKNENSRTVGPGVYLSIIELEDITESLGYQNGAKKEVKKLFLGVGE